MKTIQKIEAEIQEFQNRPHDLNPTFARSQEDIVDLVDHYWMSRYRDAGQDDDVFYNVVDTPTLVAMKQIDFDTKDIRIIAENDNHLASWFFKKELAMWMKENKIGVLLNQIVFNLPKYGHVVLKRYQDKLELCKIGTLVVNPFAESIDDTPVIEIHRYTPEKLASMRERGWDVDPVLAEKPQEDDGKYVIYERFDPSKDKNNYHIVEQTGKVLFEATKDRSPYREIKWEHVPNRWLGRGNVERLFENQIAKNELERMLRAGLQWSSKHIFQTRDETIARNLLTNVDNGEILRVLSEITPVANEERNLAAFNYADGKWNQNTTTRSFSDEILQGVRPPAETPLGTTQLQVVSAQAFFGQKREDLGLFIKDVLMEDIIPQFKNRNKSEHIFNMLTSDKYFEIFEKLHVTGKANAKILKDLTSKGKLPSKEEVNIIKGVETDKLRNRESVSRPIPANFYENLKFKIDILLTNEQIDLSSRLTTLQTALQIIGSNPSVIEDPRTAGIFAELLDLAGVSAERIRGGSTGLSEQVEQISAEKGGSIASPSVPNTPAVASNTVGI